MLGLAVVFVFFGLIIVFTLIGRRRSIMDLRQIPAFGRMVDSIGLAVEDGSRVHLSIGKGGLTGTQSAAGFVGLSTLRRIARITSASDNPPVVSAGEGTIGILAQDTLWNTYEQMGASEQYSPTTARITGLTPFSYAAGVIPIVSDEDASSNILIGNFGNEVALMTWAAEREAGFSLGGSDDLAAQAILYASAREPLVGEELYAGGAYLDAGPAHTASLRAQDFIRLGIVVVIVAGAILKFFGFLP